jgi:cytochrome P450
MSATLSDRIDTARHIVAGMRVKQPDVPRPPGPRGWRESLDMLLGKRPPHEVFAGLAEWHQPVVHLGLAGEHTHVLFSPEAIWEVFVTHGRHTRKSLALQLTRPLLGNALLTADGPDHMRHRREIQPLFHHRRIAGYVDDMNNAAEVTSSGWQDGQTIDVAESMSELTLDIIGRTIFALDLRQDSPEVAVALSTVLDGFGRGLGPLASPLSRISTQQRRDERKAIETLDALVQQMIARRVADPDQGGDLLSMLMSAKDESGRPAFTLDEVRDEAMTLVLAGHETTALAMTWAWHLLSHNPQVRQWLDAELDGLGDEVVTFDDLRRLPRTYAVIAEALRLRPPAWVIGRWLETDLRISGWELPRGSVVLAPQYVMHRDPRFWPQASQFRPQRWINAQGQFDEKTPGVPRGVWFPFGFGTRRCIGEQFAWTEAVVLLATLARRWRLEVHVPLDIPMQSAITLRPAVPMPAVVHAR